MIAAFDVTKRFASYGVSVGRVLPRINPNGLPFGGDFVIQPAPPRLLNNYKEGMLRFVFTNTKRYVWNVRRRSFETRNIDDNLR